MTTDFSTFREAEKSALIAGVTSLFRPFRVTDDKIAGISESDAAAAKAAPRNLIDAFEHYRRDRDGWRRCMSATLALLVFGTPFSVIALIGIILLIGIVKKNGIMMVDVAIQLQRNEGMDARQAIHEAAVVRLRPIMMTTAAAVLGAVPLAIGIGQGASLRQPLGVTVMGGLIVSQVFTLYTTPVIYLYLDRLRSRLARWSDGLPWNRRTDTGA